MKSLTLSMGYALYLFAVVALLGWAITHSHEALAQSTRVVCVDSFGNYRTFPGSCPIGWTFVEVAER